MFEITQYNASPLGKVVVKNPNINGIIHNIIRLVDCCLASADGMVVIFCMSHMEAPTNTGITGVLSGLARSSHRKELSSGMVLCTSGSQEYRCRDKPTRLSGVDGRVWRRDW